MLKHITAGFIALMLGALALPALAVFDPVNDDTDIFLANPSIAAERPNVLIILDNTANWNNAFANEKSALVQVVNSLNESYNVGLMMFPETGGGNDNVDGGYVKFHVRQMTDINKTALATSVNNLDKLADKGNNATTGLAMYEAYLYYAGKASLASFGKVKTDYAGNTTNNPLAAALSGNHALDASPTSASLYHSPSVDGCQKNFIIYISNGPASENASARSALQGYLATLTGKNPPDTISITPNGQQGNWADEMAQYMAGADVNSSLANTQNVITYTVEVDPGATGQGPDMTALLKSMASKGQGQYFSVTSDASGVGIVDALNQIFSQVQAVNSVFAATTLPVSVNVRGTNLNQVYIGVFRPDASKAPRWLGNLKLYDLVLNTTNNTVFLADSLGNAVQDSSTGFITSTATSFWSSSSLTPVNFWSFRTTAQNSVGGSSDAPDGELVEKGGAAQQDRHDLATSQAGRNLYTCTTGGSKPDCVPCTAAGSGTAKTCTSGSALSATPFNTTNSAIDVAALNLSTKSVSPLTGKRTVTLSALTDRKTATLSNAASGSTVSVTSLTNNVTTRTITALSTSQTRVISNITAIGTSSTVSHAITSSTAGSGSTWTIATAGHLYASGSSVTITGCAVGNQASKTLNGTYTISSVTSTSFNISNNGSAPTCGGSGSVSGPESGTTSTATVTTSTAHNFLSGQSVNITGASDANFNRSGTPGITVIDSTHFTYTLNTAQYSAGGITASVDGLTNTAAATTSAAHGFSVGNTVTIYNANPTGYNVVNATILSVPTTTSFTYSVGNTVATQLAANSATPVYVTTGGTAPLTITATAAATLPATFIAGSSIVISGSNIAAYNGTYTIVSVPTATSFTFTVSSVLPSNPSGTILAASTAGTIATVTATVPAHGFTAGQSVTVAGATDSRFDYVGTLSNITTNTFDYVPSNGGTGVAGLTPSGTFSARLTTPIAYATATAHGFTTGNSVTISGATPTAYNNAGSPVTVTVLDADNFTYPLTSAPGAATVAGTASINTTTATATSVAHGFTNGQSVTISGASPSVFNGSFTISLVDANHFTYTLASAQGDATGTITAIGGSASSTERDNIINWVRGQDNFEDENGNASATDVRASIHGDVLHSRPAVINFNRFGGNNDVYVFYGANDGVFHAIKGGTTTDASDSSGLRPGEEAWGFIPTEFFSSFQRMRNNSPSISSSNKKPYFADGPIGVLSVDGDAVGTSGYGKFGDSADTVNLYVAMRRGGRFIYALDVNSPTNPKLIWKISNATTGFSELGQTWSEPKVVPKDATLGCSFNGYSNPVVIFGAGYDPTVEDIDPATITAATSTSVTSSSVGTKTRSMGRGIYVVDAITGQLVVSIGGANSSGVNKTISGMDYAIPSDVTVIRNQTGGCVNRAYVGDTGGNLWRLDFGATYDSASPGNWVTVTKIASIGTAAAIATSISSGNPLVTANLRKFLFSPDVAAQTGFDAVVMGSGDREHPFDATVTNRMYMFKDRGNDLGPYTGTSIDILPTGAPDGNPDYPTITESGGTLYDATNDCLQVTTGACSSTTIAAQATLLNSSDGWFITLASGEKVIGNAVIISGTVFFNTNQPSASAGGGSCGSNLGIARQYQVAVADATATTNLDVTTAGLTLTDRYKVNVAGGYLPSPVHAVVQFTDANGKTVTKEVVISGPDVQDPPQTPIGTRYRKYWWKEIDQ